MHVVQNASFSNRLEFKSIFSTLKYRLLESSPVDVGEWQSIQGSVMMRELLHVVFEYDMPATQQDVAEDTGARLPWAEDHFLERVGGEPLNPAPSEAWWPFASKKEGTNVAHKSEGEAFSHTYPERMWPKYTDTTYANSLGNPNGGIRFDYGDLGDVVDQLVKSPNTRQAYLPIWFPEDTGVVHGKRIPCTLGYHFIIREGKLDISYFMRSTDLVRHFQDDVYMAVRLAQWVVKQLNLAHQNVANTAIRYEVGNLIFHTANLHIFEQDVDLLKHWAANGKTWF